MLQLPHIVSEEHTVEAKPPMMGLPLSCRCLKIISIRRVLQALVQFVVEVIVRNVHVFPDGGTLPHQTHLERFPVTWLVAQSLLEDIRSKRGR